MSDTQKAMEQALEALLVLKRAFFKSASTPEEIAQGCERGFEDYEAEWVVPSLRAIKLLQAALAAQPDNSDLLTIAFMDGYAKGKRDALAQQGEPVAYVKFRNGEVDYDCDDNCVISNTPGDAMTDEIEWRAVFTAAPAAQPDARKVIEQMVVALEMARSFGEGGKGLARAAIQAGQKWLKEATNGQGD